MKYIIVIFWLFFGITLASAQPNQVVIDETLKHPFFDTKDSVLNPLTIYVNGSYDGAEDPTKYPVRSNCMVNNDADREIRFTAYQWKNDTLFISVHETNPAYSHNLALTVTAKDVEAEYFLEQSGPALERKIVTKKCKLVLDRKPLPGGVLNGYIEYEGSCSRNCDSPVYKISGYFMLRP